MVEVLLRHENTFPLMIVSIIDPFKLFYNVREVNNRGQEGRYGIKNKHIL